MSLKNKQRQNKKIGVKFSEDERRKPLKGRLQVEATKTQKRQMNNLKMWYKQ